MYNHRRDSTGPAAVDRAAAHDGWAEDPHAELNRHLSRQGGDERYDDIAEAFAAEMEAAVSDPMWRGAPGGRGDPMLPVDLETGGIHQGRAYDQWDDEALDRLAEELSRLDEDFDPQNFDHGVLPPHPQAEEDAAPADGRRFGAGTIAAGVAGIVLLGGIGWALTGGGGIVGGDPVFVQAPTDPYKIVPEAGDTIDEPIESSALFTPANGAAGEERLVTHPEEVPDLPGVTPQVNRVILPDGQEIVTEQPAPVEAGPRRVRTVLVRPDGSLIDGSERASSALPSPTDSGAAADTSPIAAAIAQADPDLQSSAGLPPLAPSEQVVAEPPPSAVDANPPAALPGDDPLAPLLAEGAVPGLPPDGAEAAAPATDVAAAPDAAAAAPDAAAAAAPVVDAPLPPVRPEPPPALAAAPARSVEVAAAEPAAPQDGQPIQSATTPLDLSRVAAAPASDPSAAPAAPEATPAAPEAAPAAPAMAAGPSAAFVQLSSQRSEEAALSAFRALQSRHPDLLGGLTPDVRRAELGDRGVYYRVRVGRETREAAVALCEGLKAAGSDCLIARN